MSEFVNLHSNDGASEALNRIAMIYEAGATLMLAIASCQLDAVAGPTCGSPSTER